jgi:DNA-binding beta-propeller fold protein YncE
MCGSHGEGQGQFIEVTSLDVGPDGSVYVLDAVAHRVQRFEPGGRFLKECGAQGKEPGRFSWPRSVAVGPDGSVYIADTGNRRVQRFTGDGNLMAMWDQAGAQEARLQYPVLIAVRPDGGVLVLDGPVRDDEPRLLWFQADGTFLRLVPLPHSIPGPSGRATTPAGEPLIGYSEGRVLRLDAAGSYMYDFVLPGAPAHPPHAMDVGPDGVAYIANGGSSIDILALTGYDLVVLGAWTSRDRECGPRFVNPAGIAVTPDGSVLVADYERVRRLSALGLQIDEWMVDTPNHGRSRPTRLTTARDGSMYVTDGWHIFKFTLDGIYRRRSHRHAGPRPRY